MHVGIGSYVRFDSILSHLENHDIEHDIIDNRPTIFHKSRQREIYEYVIPFNEKTYATKFLSRFLATLILTLIGIKACQQKHYDLLISPVGDQSCTTIPAYITHLITRIPWTAIVQTIPEGYPLFDSQSQLVISFTKIYEHFRCFGIGFLNTFLLACYSYFPKLLLPKIYNRTWAILCVSKSLKLYLRNLGTRCKIFTVTNGISLDKILKSEISLAKRYSGIFVGRFVPEKGVFDALQIWRKVTEVFPKATLLLVGLSDKVQMSAIKKKIDEFKISQNIMIVGPVCREKVFALLKSSSLLLFPSRFETFGFVIAEAMACGLPVVCFDTPFVREFYSSRAVLTIPIGDFDSAASHVCDLLINKEKRRRLGKQALEFVKRFNWAEVAKEETQVYHMILEQHSDDP